MYIDGMMQLFENWVRIFANQIAGQKDGDKFSSINVKIEEPFSTI